MKLSPFLLAALVAWPCASRSKAATFLVESGESIQAAIDLASNGDLVEVAPGTYSERIDFGGREIALRSLEGPRSTIIDGGYMGTTVTLRDNAEITGFTITGGRASFGAGMSVGGVGTRILNNIFHANQQGGGGFGAAIAGNGASPFIAGNIFSENSSDSQHLSGAVSFVNTSSPTITDNLFVNNQGRGLNITSPNRSEVLVTNNTFWGNTSAMRINAFGSETSVVFENNLASNNIIGFDVESFGAAEVLWTHNLLYQNDTDYGGISSLAGINGNLDADPLFVAPELGDFRLRQGSPAIDTGTGTGGSAFDALGNPRLVDGDDDGSSAIDIGAFEFRPVPEPGSLPLAVLAAAGIALRRRRVTP